MAEFIQTLHRAPYSAIHPTHHLQTGKTVLITGGSKGIGLATAKAFALGAADRIVLVARDRTALQSASAQIRTAVPLFQGEILTLPCDLGSPASIECVWHELRTLDITVDILVLNAVMPQEEATMQQLGWARIWTLFEVNVRGNLVFTERFLAQPGPPTQKILLNVSSPFLHDWTMAAGYRAYGATKSTWALLQEHLTKEIPSDRLRVISYHPGFVFSEGVQELGCAEDEWDWDDADLPGHFAVWAASSNAAFLHGRFVWAAWDVEELAAAFPTRVSQDADFLRLGGVRGL